MKKYYYNLTNGLHFSNFKKPYGFIRIQSTACEQKRWNFIIQDLDNDFLFNVAIGNTCVVCDISEKKKETRALYQGVEWIKFVLYKRWLNQTYIPMVKGISTITYFLKCYSELDNRSKKKVDYFKKFITKKQINIKKMRATCLRSAEFKKSIEYEVLTQAECAGFTQRKRIPGVVIPVSPPDLSFICY